MNKLTNSKLCFGPMSKNIVDALINYANTNRINITLIPSRRQIEWDGGYVNNWTTESFSKYIKENSEYLFIQRDHGGPGQGLIDDDGYESLKYDSMFFDSIHIDPWKKYSNLEEGINWTIKLLNYCYEQNNNLYFEIGTEEAIRRFTEDELEKMIQTIKEKIDENIFNKIIFCVIQSGTGLCNGVNIGNYDNERLNNMINIVKKYNLNGKEHNGDYMDYNDLKDRFFNRLDSMNIAPELGVYETKLILQDLIERNDTEKIEKFYDLCYNSGKWVKWVDNDFIPENNKYKLIEICGHYVFSHNEFKDIKTVDDSIVVDKMINYINTIYMNIDNHSRLNSILTNEETLEEIYKIKNFPVSMSCVPLDFDSYKYMDMNVQICKKTGLLQLKSYPNFDDMYITPHNISYGKVWHNLFDLFSIKLNNLINKHNLHNILEIGGGSLLLASKLLNNGKINTYVEYEKNLSTDYVINNDKLKLIKEYFTENSKLDNKPNIIIHSHVLEHVCNQDLFIKLLSNTIDRNGYHCFIVPNLKSTYSQYYGNSFNFEHNVLITEEYIDIILNNNKFEIIEKEYYLDHSIIYITKYNNNITTILEYPNLYNEHKLLAYNFKKYYETLIININNQIKNVKEPIYLFGGHIFSQYLIMFGLDTTNIKIILDNSKEKENHKLYGTELIIKKPNIIINDINPYIIVKAASYQNEIEQQLFNLNNNSIIIK